jgi:hypothetical protein
MDRPVSRYQEHHAYQREPWRNDAACKGQPTEWWYPADGRNSLATRRARALCAECVVREDCLISALRRNEDGIWGGLNIKERRSVRTVYDVKKVLVCDYCRGSFEKPSNRQVVSLYCSDRCRKNQDRQRSAQRKRQGK